LAQNFTAYFDGFEEYIEKNVPIGWLALWFPDDKGQDMMDSFNNILNGCSNKKMPHSFKAEFQPGDSVIIFQVVWCAPGKIVKKFLVHCNFLITNILPCYRPLICHLSSRHPETINQVTNLPQIILSCTRDLPKWFRD